MPEYLGDGVMVSHDGWHIELSLDGIPGSTIYLEPIVMDKLIAYYRRVTTKPEAGDEPAR